MDDTEKLFTVDTELAVQLHMGATVQRRQLFSGGSFSSEADL